MRWQPKEPVSCYSHLFGVLLSLAGLAVLMLRLAGHRGHIVGFAVYGVSLVLLYSASTIYHWLAVSPRFEDLLRRFDHVAIFLHGGGIYTPLCLVTLRGGWGWSIFEIVWALVAAGTILKLFFEHLPRRSTAALYLGMGGPAIAAIGPLVHNLPVAGFLWLLAGGLFYTLGAVIYAVQRPDPLPEVFGFHEIFHFLVLGGSTLHFIFMLRYVVPAA